MLLFRYKKSNSVSLFLIKGTESSIKWPQNWRFVPNFLMRLPKKGLWMKEQSQITQDVIHSSKDGNCYSIQNPSHSLTLFVFAFKNESLSCIRKFRVAQREKKKENCLNYGHYLNFTAQILDQSTKAYNMRENILFLLSRFFFFFGSCAIVDI